MKQLFHELENAAVVNACFAMLFFFFFLLCLLAAVTAASSFVVFVLAAGISTRGAARSVATVTARGRSAA